MTAGECFDAFLFSRQLAGLSEKSITNYRLFIMPFLDFVGHDTPLGDIGQPHISAYFSSLLKKPLSRASRATYIRHVKIFLCWAQKEYGGSYDAKGIKVPKSPKRNVRIYSDDEVRQIFAGIVSDADWITMRNRAVIALMYDSGLRQAEVCSLRRSKVSFDDNWMVVRGKGDKERTVPMGRSARYYLQAYLALCPYSGDTVFFNRRGSPLSCNAVKLFVRKLSDKLPFELSSHKLRHNFATNYCLDQYEHTGQVDIYRLMYLMGHEDLETTRRYLHMANEIIASRGCISHLDGVMHLEN